MADVSVKMGVSGISQFKQGMNEAASSVKTLDSALKLNEKQFKDNGDAQLYMENKSKLLQKQIEAQTKVIKEGNNALQAMKSQGVDEASRSYQDMQRKVYEAQIKLQDIKSELNNVETGAKGAATGAEGMNTELGKIGEGVSWANVSEGLDKITNKLASGARAAVNFGKKILDSAKDSTEWADDLLTRSLETGLSVEDLQRMEKVAEFIDTSTDAIINAKKRMSKAVAGEGADTISELFGIRVTGNEKPDDLMWAIGDALVHMEESFDKEAAAQKVFGRSWNELLPLFKAGREEYEKMLSEQSVLTDEQVQKLGQADDAIKKVEQEIADLKNTFWAEHSETVVGLLEWVVDNKDAVVTSLTVIGGAFGAMKMASFAANLMQAINGFKTLGFLKGDAAAGAAGAAANGTGAAVAPAAGGASGFLNNMVGGMAAASVLDTANKLSHSFDGIDTLNGMTEQAVADWVDKQIANGIILAANREKAISDNVLMLNLSEKASSDTFGSAGGTAFTVEAEPELPENAGDILQEQANEISVNVLANMIPNWNGFVSGGGAGGGGGGKANVLMAKANGIWSVPFDGYMALLHKGERVVPAREVASRSFSSNMYIESMYMNNGQDADGLAARVAAENERIMSGFGN